jgi:hypothetical protein
VWFSAHFEYESGTRHDVLVAEFRRVLNKLS